MSEGAGCRKAQVQRVEIAGRAHNPLAGRLPPHRATLAANRAQRSLTRTQLLLKIDQRLLAHADKALPRPVEIDDDP